MFFADGYNNGDEKEGRRVWPQGRT